MGSGKGRARRTRTGAIVQGKPEVVVSHAKWQEFVANTGLKNVNIHDYYLGYNKRETAIFSDYEKLFAEFFRDAISAGALSLPGPYEADDFVFTVGPSSFETSVSFAGKPQPFTSFWYTFDSRNKMSNHNTTYALGLIRECIKVLIEESG